MRRLTHWLLQQHGPHWRPMGLRSHNEIAHSQQTAAWSAVRSSNCLGETLSKLTLFAFDKTGTLTQGKFSLDVVDILDDNYSKEQILDIAAQLESYSEHPIASAFKEFKGQRKFDDVQLHPGIGISAQFDNT